MNQREAILQFYYALVDVKSNAVGVGMKRLAVLGAMLLLACAIVVAEEPLTILSGSLSPLTSGQEFRYTLAARGGIPPYRWDVPDGVLPEGITLSHDGILSGRPSKAGAFMIAVRVIDSSHPAHAVEKRLNATVTGALLLDWLQAPQVRDNRIDGAVKVSNGSKDTFDLTVVVEAVAENGRATAIGYEHFKLKPGVEDVPIKFGNTLPHGGYVIHADAVAEVPARNNILRQRLQSTGPLQIAAGP